MPGRAAGRQVLYGHVPAVVSQLAPVGRLESSQHLSLAISLPLRNQQALADLLGQLYDPSSPNYRRYLTPAQFAERFGPSETDYQAVIDFAKSHGLRVTAMHPNRTILDVEGAVSDIENTFHVTMQSYRHPNESRNFYAPNTDPSVDLAVPILDIIGLDNYSLPHPNYKIRSAGLTAKANAIPQTGSGTNGTYAGNDFRAAYVPGTSLTGAGQSIGLLEFDGYYASDITSYETQFGLPNVSLVNVSVNGGVSTPGNNNIEVALDIEMGIAMAPGISSVYVYEAPNGTSWDSILNRIATDNLAKQISCSWTGGGPNSTAQGIFQQMAAQGQSFFNASGDSDAYTGSIPFPADSPNITVVGGTTLTTTGAVGSYTSETVWNWGGGTGSSGGVSTKYSIPTWQQGINMASNLGSTTMRNVPDVAMTADNVYVAYNKGSSEAVGGTSCAAPLWAAFTALVNQQAVVNTGTTVGFINPAVYAIGKGTGYASDFHDTTVGNNFSSSSPAKFPAETGYDLCTGWGTPNGSALINALAGQPAPIITTGSPLPNGAVGTVYNQTVTASGGTTPYTWSVSSGSLPSGLSLSSVGVISGTPSAPGTANFTLQVTGGNSQFATKAFSLTILPLPPVITSALSATAPVGQAFSYQITATNNPTSYGASGLPAVLNVNPANGLISGTPTVAGTFNVSISATNAGGTGSASMTINVQEPPSITNGPPPAATLSTDYSFTYTTSGYPTPTFALTAGTFPPGLTLSTAGILSGTPAQEGIYTGTITASNGVGPAATQNFTITVFTTFNSWASEYFTTPQLGEPNVSGPNATPENDGIPNLLKYLFDIDPANPMSATDHAVLPVVGLDTTTTPETQYLTLTYRESASATGLTINVQTSSDLQTWTTVSPPDLSQQVGTDSTTGDPIMEVGVTVNGSTEQFIRLNVTSP
jgi:hypothetical protein